MKLTSLCVAFILSGLTLTAQQPKIIEGPITEVCYKGKGSIKNTAGIIGDNYFVVENDYGRAFDFNNGIKTVLSIFSIKTGELKKRVELNELVAQQTNGKVNKIIFAGVNVWKQNVVGFYTYKDPNGTEFTASTLILNKDGELQKVGQEIGAFTHQIVYEDLEGQAANRKSAKNTLSVSNSLRYTFSSDSEHLVVQCKPEKGKKNFRLKVFAPGMILEKDIYAAIPSRDKREYVDFFGMDNKGVIVIGTWFNSFVLNTINTLKNDEVVSKNIDLPGKALWSMILGFTSKGSTIIAGTYHDNTKGYGLHGVYAANISKPATALEINTRDIPQSFLEKYHSKKSLKKQEGLYEFFSLNRAVANPGGGICAIGQYNTTTTTQRGSTGALNTYEEQTFVNVAYSIDENGKVLWESINDKDFIENKAFATRHSRVEYAPTGDRIHGLIVKSKAKGVVDYSSSVEGVTNEVITGSKEITDFSFVEGTLKPIGDKEFVALAFDSHGDPKIRLVKVYF